MKRYYVSIDLIDEANEMGWIDSLAYFHYIKHVKSHGVFKNHQSAANAVGATRQTIAKHVKVLKKNNLVKKRNGVYVLATRAKLIKNSVFKGQTTIKINKADTVKDVEKLLLMKLVERFAAQQRRNITLNKDYELAMDTHVEGKRVYQSIHHRKSEEAKAADLLKRIGKRGFTLPKLNKKYPELNNKVAFTYEWLGDRLGISKTSAFNLFTFAKSRGLMETKTICTMLMSGVSFKQYEILSPRLSDTYTHHFYIGGKVYKNLASEYKQKKYWEIESKVVAHSADIDLSSLSSTSLLSR